MYISLFFVRFTLPVAMVTAIDSLPHTPVIMDVVYKPARTPLLDQAKGKGYVVVQGGSMLYEQGAQQFEIWQKRRAPREVMRQAVFRDIEDLE